jgi:CubicO group peptidase (beta-lactamase class C family)
MHKLRIVVALAAACGSGGKSVVEGTSAPAGSPVAAPRVEPLPPPAAPAAPVETRKLDKDTVLTTASGATLSASAGWTVAQAPDRLTMTAPEGDLTVVLVEVPAADRDAAVAKAWAKVRPGFDLKVAQALDQPARRGWDAVSQIVYVTPAAEKRVVVALPRKKGPMWYVVLADGSEAAFDRRGAQLGTAVQSLKPKGLERESFAGKKANPLDAKRLAELEVFLEQARVTARVPGVAVAIVQGGQIVFEKGFGVRELGKPAKVGPNTLFMIGSATKSLTTLMMARLVDAGKLAWDAPVTQVLPSFALGDDAITKQATMRHTVCACTGMPRQDFEMIFEFGKLTVEDRLASMKTMKPTTAFGETFQYSNLMVSAGGFAAGHAHAPKLKLGAAYDKAMAELVFTPLGMKSTTFDFKRVAKGDHALPHPLDLRAQPAPVPITMETWVVAVRPAGAAWSSVHDLTRVLLLELGKGRLDGKTIVAEANLMKRRESQVKIRDDASYGLGLFVEQLNEVPVVGHGGNTGGFTADMFWLPEHDVGVAVLANAGGANAFRNAVRRRVLELLFDGSPEAVDDLAAAMQRQQKVTDEEWALVQPDPDPAWFAELSGAWAAPGLGRIELRTEKGKAIFDAGEWKVTAGKKVDRDGTVKLVTTGVPVAGLELIPRDEGGKKVLVLDAGQHSYVFERDPGKRAKDTRSP